MIGFIILGILYEGLKAGRDKLKQRNAVRNKGIEDHSRPQSNSLHDYHSDGYSDEQTPLVKGATP